jgi:arylsulfatase A-like enzyme
MNSFAKLSQLFLASLFGLLFVGFSFADKPNVLIFFIDDMGYHDLGCYGSEFYETPNIDRLAERSVQFTNFYSAHPVCSPTRASLMTGKAPQRLGITQWIPQPSKVHLPSDETTLGEAFQEAGYETGYIGKWHLGAKDENMPQSNGFGWTKAVNRAGQPASYYHPYSREKKNGIGYWDVPDMEDSQPGDYLTDHLTDHAIDFVTADRDKPFLLCFSHYAVHTPIQSPETLVEKYRLKSKEQFDGSASELVAERNNAVTTTRQDDPAYAAMVENLDSNVGRVLDALERSGKSENTIIIFTSDNGGLTTLRKRGGPTSVKPLRAGKGWCYEGGIRVPTLISWPAVLQSNETAVPAITTDIFPTLLELAAIPSLPGQHLDGLSLAPWLNGQADFESRVLGWHYPHNHGSGHTPSTAIRYGDWKLLWLSKPDEYELYNLAQDIGETNNLADSQPEKVKELSAKLKGWLERTKMSKAKQ